MRTRPSERKGDWRVDLSDISSMVERITSVAVVNWQIHGWKAFIFLLFQLRLMVVSS